MKKNDRNAAREQARRLSQIVQKVIMYYKLKVKLIDKKKK